MAKKSRSTMQQAGAARPAQPSAQTSSAGQMSASPFGDPSPGDENPRDLPLPVARDDAAAMMAEWRQQHRAGRKGKPQRMAQSAKRKARQQSAGDAAAFGDPSPGDENPRPIEPRGPQRG